MDKIDIMQASQLTSPNPVSLICTKREDGNTNIATVSWYTYLSFNPGMVGFSVSKQSHTGEMVKKFEKAVLTIPGSELKETVFQCGSSSGNDINKVEEFGSELETIENQDIKIPSNSRLAVVLSLKEVVDAGDHFFYVCTVDEVYGDESKTPLFAFDGYASIDTVN